MRRRLRELSHFFESISIRNRISLGFALLVGLMVLAVLTGFRQIGTATESLGQYKKLNERAVLIVEIDGKIAELQRNVSNFTHSGYSSVEKKVNLIVDDLKADVKKLDHKLSGKEEAELAERLKNHLQRHSETFAAAVTEQTLKEKLIGQEIPDLFKKLGNVGMRKEALWIESNILSYLRDPSGDYFREIDKKIIGFHGSLSSPAHRQTLADLREKFLRLSQAKRSYLYLVNVVMSGEALEFKYVSRELKNLVLQKSERVSEGIVRQVQETRHFAFIYLLVFITLGIVMGWLISMGVSRPIAAITETFGKLVDGHTDIQIPGQKRRDEIGVLSRAADVFRRQGVALEKSNDELIQFSYRTSHDIKAPLTTSKRLAEFIVEDIQEGESDEALKNAKQIVKQMENLENLVTDILSLARAEVEVAAPKAVDFVGIFNEIEDRLLWLLEESGCDLEKVIDLKTEIQGDRIRYAQILENLISNGLKYRNVKNEKCFVRVEIMESLEALTLSVVDNGMGIPENKQDDLFKMFTRFHPKEATGSGLGMSIVKKHIDYLNGNIDVESSPNGTRFNITIPKERTL